MRQEEFHQDIHDDAWTDKLSDYLDGELSTNDRAALDAHLRECGACTAVLDELRRVVMSARNLTSHPPSTDLWPAVSARLEPKRDAPKQPTRIAFTVPQLAAAALLLMALSGALGIELASTYARKMFQPPATTAADASRESSVEGSAGSAQPFEARAPDSAPVGFADAQYDAAVGDLERMLKQGRGRLDGSAIAVVEHNLQIIDQAMAQAREALASDPANTYLSGHIVEARRRKLDLLRRAAALADAN